jgi:hypothetical protein
MIMFSVTPRTGGTVAYLMNADGSATRVLFQTDTGFDGFAFSPDNRRIVYHPTGGATAFILDVTRPNATPEALPERRFAPLSWSSDGRRVVGSEIRPGQPNRPLVFDLASRQFEELADVGAGAVWLGDGGRVLINRDGVTKIQIVDRATKRVTDVTSVTAPSTLLYDVSADGRTLYYIVSEFEADVYRMTVSGG